MPKSMSKDEASSILKSLETFDKLERKATDQVGWIALRYSCSRPKADRLINQARVVMEAVS